MRWYTFWDTLRINLPWTWPSFLHWEKIYNEIMWKRQKQPPKVFYNKGVLKNFEKFIWKHLCLSLFFNKNLWMTASEKMSKKIKIDSISETWLSNALLQISFVIWLFSINLQIHHTSVFVYIMSHFIIDWCPFDSRFLFFIVAVH